MLGRQNLGITAFGVNANEGDAGELLFIPPNRRRPRADATPQPARPNSPAASVRKPLSGM